MTSNSILHYHYTGHAAPDTVPRSPAVRILYEGPRCWGSLWILRGDRLWERIQDARASGVLPQEGHSFLVTVTDHLDGPLDWVANRVVGALLAAHDRAARTRPITGGGSL